MEFYAYTMKLIRFNNQIQHVLKIIFYIMAV